MTKQTTKDKIITYVANYVLGRLKVIVIMIVLSILVKNHPGWDTFFVVMIILQSVLAVLMVLSAPKKIENAQKKERENKSGGFYEDFYKKSYGQHKKVSFGNDISTSAKLLGINVIQDDENTIKKKYRQLAMKWHPDKFATDTLENQEIAKRNFQKVNSAYNKIKEYKNIK